MGPLSLKVFSFLAVRVGTIGLFETPLNIHSAQDSFTGRSESFELTNCRQREEHLICLTRDRSERPNPNFA